MSHAPHDSGLRWTCPACGHRNARASLFELKICENCGASGERPELPEYHGDAPRGIE